MADDERRVLQAFDTLSDLLQHGRGRGRQTHLYESHVPAGWAIDESRCQRTGSRQHFRLRARSSDGETQAIALFCDMPCAGSPLCTAPTVKLLAAALKLAATETGFDAAADGPVLDIILLRNDGAAHARKEVDRAVDKLWFEGKKLRAELWHVRDLQYNVLRHVEVPPHRLVPPGDFGTLPRGGPAALPLMLASDPVARALALRPGDVVRIDRTDSRLGPSIYYRRVVRYPDHFRARSRPPSGQDEPLAPD